ncbi:MAG: hypothetical protein WD055_04870 [Candidatus Dependentiae bacterium]
MNTKLIRLCLTLCLSFTCISLSANAYDTGEQIGEGIVEAPLQAASGLLGVVSGAAEGAGRRTERVLNETRYPRYNQAAPIEKTTIQYKQTVRPITVKPINNN